MANIKELLAKIEETGLKDKLAACKSVDDILAIAKDLDIELESEDIEKLTDISEEDLTGVAGGAILKDGIPSLKFN